MSGEQILIIVDRLDEMARSLRAIADELSKHAPSRVVPAEIMHIVREGSVIAGVREWRNRTGIGIIEAKRAIDRALVEEASHVQG